jgi:hypothetical protein
MIRTRLALLAAATAVATAAGLAGAAPTTKPQLTDATGDAKALGASYDIVSGLLTTTGKTTTKKVGKKTVSTYKPTALVAKLTLAGAPVSTTGTVYSFGMSTSACGGGSFSFTYTPGALLQSGDLFIIGCGTDSGTGPAEFMSDVKAVLAGNTITWTMPLADMGSDLPLTSTFSGFSASVDLNDPVFGLIGTGLTGGSTSIDSATGDTTWKLG